MTSLRPTRWIFSFIFESPPVAGGRRDLSAKIYLQIFFNFLSQIIIRLQVGAEIQVAGKEERDKKEEGSEEEDETEVFECSLRIVLNEYYSC